jgi:hypothetical protein
MHNLDYVTFNFLVQCQYKKVQLPRPIGNFASCQRSVYCASINICNTLPASTAELVKDKKHFMLALKRPLIVESSYVVNEYLNYQHEVKTHDRSIRKEVSTLM